MLCLYCAHPGTRVVDSRLTEPAGAVRRRRECLGCGARFTTYERAEAVPLSVRKRDGRVEPFDRDKLLHGLLRAATKRPIELTRLEAIADGIAGFVRRAGGQADAERIGELALSGLIGLDRVAAIRFASVYRKFEDLAEFEAELHRLEAEPVPGADQLRLEPLGESAAGDPRGAAGATSNGGPRAPAGAPVPSEPGGSIAPSPARPAGQP